MHPLARKNLAREWDIDPFGMIIEFRQKLALFEKNS